MAQRILDLNEDGIEFDNIGILFRADYQSANVELELTKKGIPYEKRGGLKFFEKKHIKDVTAFVRLFDNEQDELAWKRVLCLFEGIGPATSAKIWQHINKSNQPINSIIKYKLYGANRRSLEEFKNLINLAKRKSKLPNEVINIFLKKFYNQYIKDNFPNHKDRKLDLLQYMKLSSRYSNITKFLEDIVLDADLTNREAPALVGSSRKSGKPKKEKLITLSTIHQAKGLEWRDLFLISVAENRFPLSIVYEENNLEEERRLFYVACSRAKRNLEITVPLEDWTPWGGYELLKESKFIKELPKNCYEEWDIEED